MQQLTKAKNYLYSAAAPYLWAVINKPYREKFDSLFVTAVREKDICISKAKHLLPLPPQCSLVVVQNTTVDFVCGF